MSVENYQESYNIAAKAVAHHDAKLIAPKGSAVRLESLTDGIAVQVYDCDADPGPIAARLSRLEKRVSNVQWVTIWLSGLLCVAFWLLRHR